MKLLKNLVSNFIIDSVLGLDLAAYIYMTTWAYFASTWLKAKQTNKNKTNKKSTS